MPGSTIQKAAQFLPSEAGGKRIDLFIDGEATSIRLSSWVDGLGWCGERTLVVEPEMLDDLHRMIGAARVRLRHQRERETGPETASSVLQFPASN